MAGKKSVRRTRKTRREKNKNGNGRTLAQRKEALRRRELSALGIQRALKVGASNDKYEKEADAVALNIMNKSPGGPGRKPSTGGPRISRMATQSASGGFTANNRVAGNVNAMKTSGGRPLSNADRNFLEPRFGRDLSHIRVHTDDRAARTADDIQAKAFTTGNHIAFNQGEYKPGTHEGRRLLAHEITHTFQQGGAKGAAQREVVQRQLNNCRRWHWRTDGDPVAYVEQTKWSDVPDFQGRMQPMGTEETPVYKHVWTINTYQGYVCPPFDENVKSEGELIGYYYNSSLDGRKIAWGDSEHWDMAFVREWNRIRRVN